MSVASIVLEGSDVVASVGPILDQIGERWEAQGEAQGAKDGECLLLFKRAGEPTTEGAGRDQRVVNLWERKPGQARANPFEDADIQAVIGSAPVAGEDVAAALGSFAQPQLLALKDVVGDSAVIERRSVYSSYDKFGLLEELRAFMNTHGVPRAVQEGALVALDELYTNAVYNAPVQDGTRLFKEAQRTEDVQSPKPVMVAWGIGNGHLFVRVRDSYGSLTPSEYTRSLSRCYQSSKAVCSTKAGGAGVGSFMVLENANRLVLNLDPGQSAEFVYLRRVDQRKREFARTTPSFHIFVANSRWPRPRSKVRRRSSATVSVRGGGQKGEALVQNLSQCGARLQLSGEGRVQPGAPVEVCLPDGLMRQAIVRWVSSEGGMFGVEFLQPLSDAAVSDLLSPR